MANKQSVQRRKEETPARPQKKDYTMIVFWVIVGVLVAVFALQFIMGNDSDDSGMSTTTIKIEDQAGLDAFAKCITEKGAVFYGTEWCPHCKNQKELFGESMQYVNYIDCDKSTTACQAAGIKGYPTWKIAGGSDLVGTQPLSRLASATGCTL